MWKEKTSHDGDSLGGVEAQTGNLVHEAMHAFHASTKKKVSDRILDGYNRMKVAKKDKYPGGDLATAESLFHSWAEQETSATKGVVVGSEIELRYKWPVFYSAAEYSTYRKAAKGKRKTPVPEEEALITGHVDELRRLDDVIYVCDEKTGWTGSDKMMGAHVAQLAAYVVGVKLLNLFPGVTKFRGYIKRTRDLQSKKGEPYYYKVIDSFEQAEELMWVIGLRLGEIAQGVITHTPGEHCRNCPLEQYPGCLTGAVRPPVNQNNKFNVGEAVQYTEQTKPVKKVTTKVLPRKPLSTF